MTTLEKQISERISFVVRNPPFVLASRIAQAVSLLEEKQEASDFLMYLKIRPYLIFQTLAHTKSVMLRVLIQLVLDNIRLIIKNVE